VLPLGGPTNAAGLVDPARREWAVPGMIRDVANALALTVEGPGRAVAGQIPESALSSVAMTSALTLAGGGLGLGEVPEGALATTAGRFAKTADLDQMRLAQQFEANGIAPEQIHAATGWYRGADEQWKFTIPDDEAKLKNFVTGPDGNVSFGWPEDPSIERRRLGDVYDNPKLFAAYPELKDMEFIPQDLGGGMTGAYRDQTNTMLLGPQNETNSLSTILHEGQHAVQGIEGFGQGGNVSEFLDPKAGASRENLLGAEDKYRRLSGEVEARQTEEQFAKRDWSQYPPSIEGYTPFTDQIVKLPDGRSGTPVQVHHDPFSQRLEPVDHDPFSAVPVDHNPFVTTKRSALTIGDEHQDEVNRLTTEGMASALKRLAPKPKPGEEPPQA
jgi:hypothetical protein